MRLHPRPLRHRLEHVSRLESIEEIRRIRKLGMLVTITPSQERTRPVPGRPWARNYKTLIEEGVNPIAVTDATGTIPSLMQPSCSFPKRRFLATGFVTSAIPRLPTAFSTAWFITARRIEMRGHSMRKSRAK
jgi:hypothetical protein